MDEDELYKLKREIASRVDGISSRTDLAHVAKAIDALITSAEKGTGE